MKQQVKWAIYGIHLGPLFAGSKTACLAFLAFVMREEPNGQWSIRRES